MSTLEQPPTRPGDTGELAEATAAGEHTLEITPPATAPLARSPSRPEGHARERAAALTPGTELGGRYRIERLLGCGGMGAVYLAHDDVLGSEVALKFVHPELARSEQALRRLRAEVLLAQKVTHRNVCRTYDLEQLGDDSVVKMEYIDGETLERRLEREGALPLDEAIAIARAVAAGLEAAHAQGVIHCDLKPHNILVEHTSGRVVLMDFGIARAATRSDDTGDRSMWGTPEYMAPEQASGLVVDPRTDLYSLGCVLYQMVTGEVPYAATVAIDCAQRHLQDPIPDPRRRRPEVPEWLAQVICRLLAKKPWRRFPSATALIAALAGPHRRDWRRLLAPAALVALGLAASLVQQRLQHSKPPWQPHIVDRQPAYEENADYVSISPDGQHLAYISNRSNAWRMYIEPLIGGPARPVPGDIVLYPLRWTHDSRALVGVSAQRQALRVPVGGGASESLATSAEDVEDCAGRLVLALLDTPACPACVRLVVREPTGERELAQLPPGVRLRGLRCDPEGRRLVYAAGELGGGVIPRADLYLLPLAGGPPRQLTFDRRENAYPVFAPDGRTVLFSSRREGPADLWEIASSGGKPLRLTHSGQALALDVSPEGRLLVFDRDVTTYHLYEHHLDTGQSLPVTHSVAAVSQPHPTPDGQALLVRLARDGQRHAALLSLVSAEERILARADAVALGPGAREAIYAVNEVTSAGLWAIPLSGGAPRPLAQLPGPVAFLSADPEGTIHATIRSDEQYVVWRVPLGGGEALREEVPELYQIVSAPQGGWRLLAFAGNESRRETRWRLVPPDRPPDDPGVRELFAHTVAWMPDGSSFLTIEGALHLSVLRYPLGSGPPELLLDEVSAPGDLAVAADGKRFFFSQLIGHVYRQMITNFAERPRPKGG